MQMGLPAGLDAIEAAIEVGDANTGEVLDAVISFWRVKNPGQAEVLG